MDRQLSSYLNGREPQVTTDIDIIAEPGTDLDKYLDSASEIFPFKDVEEQKRI